MFGILMAFKKYSISMGVKGIFTSEWVGLKHFIEFFTDYRFKDLLYNTLGLSILKILFSFPLPIILAIMLNEVGNKGLKKVFQTVSYLPHFISWVIIAGMANAFLSDTNGVINKMLMGTNIISEPIPFLTSSEQFWGVAVSTAVWKETGWWSIIFLAAIAGIDPTMYEAAEIDGAGRMKRILHITIPAMKSSIVVVLILTIGSLLGGGLVGANFEQSYLLGNPMNNSRSEIIQTYAFKTGLVDGRFDYATAVEFIQSIISVFLIFTSNYLAKKFTDSGLF
jgi:putative aldouronate transport system permease protein